MLFRSAVNFIRVLIQIRTDLKCWNRIRIDQLRMQNYWTPGYGVPVHVNVMC